MTIKVIGRGAQVGGRRHEYAPGYVFTTDAACADYDWLVVYDEMETDDVGTLRGGMEELRCPRAHTILATCEPTSIKHYSHAYTRQFGHLLTNRPFADDRHPGYFLGRGYYRWLTERSVEQNRNWISPEKTRNISVVCSSKRMSHTRHHDRYQLICKMAEAIPDLDWYGHGVRECDNKCAILDPCKYHLAIENHIAPHHWSEKIADALLCGCLPFYAGAPDIGDDLPRDSYIPIPIDDPDEAIRIVRESIANGAYEKRLEAINAARELLLSKYNFWAQVIAVIESSAGATDEVVRPGEFIVDRKLLRKQNLSAALEDGWYHFRQYMRI